MKINESEWRCAEENESKWRKMRVEEGKWKRKEESEGSGRSHVGNRSLQVATENERENGPRGHLLKPSLHNVPKPIPCLWASCFGQLSTCLLRLLWFFLIQNVFLGLTCNNKAKSASFSRQKYHCDFLCYWAVKSYPQFLHLPNPVGKITITSRPASSSFTAVSCSLLRIIFCFSLLTLRRSRALLILNSAESATIFPNSLPSAALRNMRRII